MTSFDATRATESRIKTYFQSSGTYTIGLKGKTFQSLLEKNSNLLTGGDTMKIFLTSPSELEIENAFQTNRFVYINVEHLESTKLPSLCQSLKKNQVTFFAGYEEKKSILEEIEKCRRFIRVLHEEYDPYYPRNDVIIIFILFSAQLLVFFILSSLVLFLVHYPKYKYIVQEFDKECRSSYEDYGITIRCRMFGLYLEIIYDSNDQWEVPESNIRNQSDKSDVEFVLTNFSRNFAFGPAIEKRLESHGISKEEYLETLNSLTCNQLRLNVGSVVWIVGGFLLMLFALIGGVGGGWAGHTFVSAAIPQNRLIDITNSSGMFTVALSGNTQNKIDFLYSIEGIEKEIITDSPPDLKIEESFKSKKFVFINMDVLEEQRYPKLCETLKIRFATFIAGYEKATKGIEEIKKCRKNIEDIEFDSNLSGMLIAFKVIIGVGLFGSVLVVIVFILFGWFVRKEMRILQESIKKTSEEFYESKGITISLIYYLVPMFSELRIKFEDVDHVQAEESELIEE